ncbi:hypothetical protein ODE01S_05600 [Oceanithermus desulfurans NBRC 100063]|uniref:MFS transporter n=2 Tax=Oceanithermus desulfurans TaxID=227924 RepID=A0A511RJY3_9DEIN|nr:hypothetical protein ODE01S_05600 [Oceanithermus desulfurans NBRC 100063]
MDPATLRDMTERAWRGYLLGYGFEVSAWVLALTAAPFLALAAGPGWVAAGAVLGVGPRLASPWLARWVAADPLARLALAEALAVLVFLGAAGFGSWVPGAAALAVYGAAGAVGVLEGVVGPLLVAAGRAEREWTRANAVLTAVGLGLPVAVWPLAGTLTQRTGLGVALGAAAALLGVRALGLARLGPARGAFSPAPPAARGSGLRSPVRFWPLGVALAGAFSLLGYLQVKVPLWLDAQGLGPQALGGYGAAFSGGMLLGAAGVWALGFVREGRLLRGALLLAMSGALGLTAPTGLRLVAGAALLGAGLSGVQAAGTTLLQRRLTGVALGAAVGWIAGAGAAATALGAVLAGLLPGAWNPAVPALAAVLVVAGRVGLMRGGRQ